MDALFRALGEMAGTQTVSGAHDKNSPAAPHAAGASQRVVYDGAEASGLRISARDGTLETLRGSFSRELAERLRAGGRDDVATKLQYRRSKRAINTAAKERKRSGYSGRYGRGAEFESNHPWLLEHERSARAAREALDNKQRSWHQYRYWSSIHHGNSAAHREAQLREQRAFWRRSQHVRQAPTSSGTAGVDEPAKRKARMRTQQDGAKREMKELLESAKEEEAVREAWLHDVARTAADMSGAVGGVCRACGECDANMLALRCGHVTLCRECWEGGGGKVCRDCGGGCKLAIQIFRPLG